MAIGTIDQQVRDRTHGLIRDAIRQRLWVLCATLILCYPAVVRTARVALKKPPGEQERSPFVYLMR